MIHAAQMNAFATIETLEIYEIRRQTRAGGNTSRERKVLIVAGYVVLRDRYVSRISQQNAFEIGIFNCESGHRDLGQPGMVVTVDVNAIGQASGIDDGVLVPLTN